MFSAPAYRTAAALARGLPPPVADALARTLARLAFAARVPARAAAEANLARLAPGAGADVHRRQARAAFENFALAFAAFLRQESARAVPVVGEEHLSRARSSGRGVIVLSAHLGEWERGAACLAARGVTIHIAARRHRDPAVEAVFASCRSAAGVHVLPSDRLFSRAAERLRRGEWVAIMADRDAARREVSVCAWAAALARRSGALVLPAVMVRAQGRCPTLWVEEPQSPERCRAGAFRATLRGWLERWPEQWSAFEPLSGGLA